MVAVYTRQGCASCARCTSKLGMVQITNPLPEVQPRYSAQPDSGFLAFSQFLSISQVLIVRFQLDGTSVAGS